MTDRWPTLLPGPRGTGRIRVALEDFIVDEVPAYLPGGSGSHLLLQVEKRDRTTDDVVRSLARHLGIPRSDVGVAGLKDRRAITRQWLSVPGGCEDAVATFRLEGVRILQSGRHGNKLKTGHLRGNRFRIRIRDVARDHLDDVIQRCGQLQRLGIPNYYGPQRFGRGGTNEAEGRELLCGRKRRVDKKLLRLLLSSVQSGLFNDLLAVRIREGLLGTAMAGDLLTKSDTGGMFLCEDTQVDQPRMDAFEIHATGPMFGKKMRRPEGRPAEMERSVLAEARLEEGAFSRYPKLTRGARRALRLAPADFALENHEDGVTLTFALPAGSYATAVLREVIALQEPDGF